MQYRIKKLLEAICLAMPVIQGLDEGYDVYIVTDASGGVSLEAHEMAVLRKDEGRRSSPAFIFPLL
jgi:nicotinamidase-related amidase